MNEETKFSVGDAVEWCGVRGVVDFVGDSDSYIRVKFSSGQSYACFTKEGKYFSWHTEPSLKLISKAKKKRKVKLYAYLVSSNAYDCRELAFFDKPLEGFKYSVPELDKEVEIAE